MDAHTAVVALVQAEAERLAQYLSTLPSDAWRQSSACEAWEVRDVVAHLVEVAEDYQHRITCGVQGEVEPPAELTLPGTVTDATIAQLAVAYRERLGEALLPTFQAQYAQLCALLAQLSDED